MARGFGSDYSKFCTCEEKDKANWFVRHDWRESKGYAYVECKVCREYWKTKANYVSELLGEEPKKESFAESTNENLLNNYVNAIINERTNRASKLEKEILKRMEYYVRASES